MAAQKEAEEGVAREVSMEQRVHRPPSEGSGVEMAACQERAVQEAASCVNVATNMVVH